MLQRITGADSTAEPTPLTVAPASIPTVALPTPAPLPTLRDVDQKHYMLKLINAERAKAGVPPVVLGDNVAAQLHAESALANCFSSHWGVDGLKPHMRYSLAGGYQSNSENGSGLSYCITSGENYRPIESIEQEIQEHMEGLVESTAHYRNIVGRWHRKVHIGLAWDRYNSALSQHFEGDYVDYDRLPSITPGTGTLSFSGRTKNGAQFAEQKDLSVTLYYDPPPHELTPGQLARTYCYTLGTRIASFRWPLPAGWAYDTDEYRMNPEPGCADPYEVPADKPAPTSPWDASLIKAGAMFQSPPFPWPIPFPWITASKWQADGNLFAVTADISPLLREHRAGVYTILVWGVIDGEEVIISQHSMFHEVVPPQTYGMAIP